MVTRGERWRRGLSSGLRGPLGLARAEQQGRSWGSLLLHRLDQASAHSGAGVVVVAVVVVWTIVGAFVDFAPWWENLLYIVSSTTTLVMLFAIQHTQARQQSATQRKLDEILRALPRADGRFIAVEEAPDLELQELAVRGRGDREQSLGGDRP